ncbi:MAG: YidC/Oxa1 family membrane protein insertase [Candidatus Uhrbacteria bacterium]
MWTTVVVQPLFNILVGFYNLLGSDLGVAIIALTLLIRLVLYPLAQRSLKSQVAMQEIQPKMKALQAQHKGDKEALAKATMEMYRESKVNPLSSCLPTLIQLPFLFGIYWALRLAVMSDGSFDLLYGFVEHPTALNETAFGFLPLGSPNIVLAVVAGAAQYWVTKMLITRRPPAAVAEKGGKDEGMMAMMNKQMLYVMPVMTVVIGATLPAGLTLYWFVTTVFQGVQQRIMFRRVTGDEKQEQTIDTGAVSP